MSKRSKILALIGLNLFLLAALILSAYDVPVAQAQPRGRPGDFLMATTQIHEDYEVVTIINIQAARMYSFVPREAQGGAKLQYSGWRDLTRDFGRQAQ